MFKENGKEREKDKFIKCQCPENPYRNLFIKRNINYVTENAIKDESVS